MSQKIVPERMTRILADEFGVNRIPGAQPFARNGHSRDGNLARGDIANLGELRAGAVPGFLRTFFLTSFAFGVLAAGGFARFGSVGAMHPATPAHGAGDQQGKHPGCKLVWHIPL